MRIPFISLVAAGSLALGGCAYGDFGYGAGLGYGDPYGYGYGSPYASYGYGYGSPYYGAGYAPFGWYDDYYYPGTGTYVYDSYRRPRVWNDRQRTYWTSHRSATNQTANWSGFRDRNRTDSTSTRTDSDTDRHHHRR